MIKIKNGEILVEFGQRCRLGINRISGTNWQGDRLKSESGIYVDVQPHRDSVEGCYVTFTWVNVMKSYDSFKWEIAIGFGRYIWSLTSRGFKMCSWAGTDPGM